MINFAYDITIVINFAHNVTIMINFAHITIMLDFAQTCYCDIKISTNFVLYVTMIKRICIVHILLASVGKKYENKG